MKRYLFVIIISLLGFTTIHAQEIKIVGDPYPPLHFEENGRYSGLAVEIIHAMLTYMDYPTKMGLYPWARAYKMAVHDKNILVMAMVRLPEREKLFKWVKPYYRMSMYLYKLKKRTDIQINKLEDAKQYKIGLVRDDFTTQYLKTRGIVATGSEIVVRHSQNIEKLKTNRIEIAVFDELLFNYELKKLGFKLKDFEKVYYLDDLSTKEYYLAFSQKTDDTIVEQFKTAFDRIREDGSFNKIMSKYIK